MAIIQRKNKADEVRYLVRVRDRFGKWYPSETFIRKPDAERYERSLLTKRDRGGEAASPEQRQMTFEDIWNKWSVECRNRVSHGWRTSQNTVARKYLLPTLGRLKLIDVKSQDIGLLFSDLERKGLSPQSILHVYNVLHKMFEDAVDFFECVPLNPVRRRFRPRVPRTEREFLSPTDSWKLLEACRSHPLGIAVWISMLAGLRPGEVQALRWPAWWCQVAVVEAEKSVHILFTFCSQRPAGGDL